MGALRAIGSNSIENVANLGNVVPSKANTPQTLPSCKQLCDPLGFSNPLLTDLYPIRTDAQLQLCCSQLRCCTFIFRNPVINFTRRQ